MSDETIQLVTCECAPNIALIKYWGKLDDNLILPLNSSVSITLDKKILNTKTSVMLIKKSNNANRNEKDVKLWLNNKLSEFNENDSVESHKNNVINIKRFLNILNKLRSNCQLENSNDYLVRVCTQNTFPTAAGMASSASGYACLALCLAHAYKYNGDLSELARLGSGSACRSCYGGYVKWQTPLLTLISDMNQKLENLDSLSGFFSNNKNFLEKNEEKYSNESIAIQLFKSNHWPELNVLVLVLNDKQKETSSTDGMKNSVQTSELLIERMKIVELKRLNKLVESINEKNFHLFAQIIMQDSNQFHSICMDTYPPIFYLNEYSIEIINFVNAFNSLNLESIGNKAAYSFDAGPNAFIFILDEYLKQFLYLIKHFYFQNEQFSSQLFQTYLSDDERIKLLEYENVSLLEAFKKFNFNNKKKLDNVIKFILHSKVGDEPSVLIGNNFDNSLLNSNGEPKLNVNNQIKESDVQNKKHLLG